MPGNTMPSGELQKAYIMGFTHATCSMFWSLTTYTDTELLHDTIGSLLKYYGIDCGCFCGAYAPVRSQIKVLLKIGPSS